MGETSCRRDLPTIPIFVLGLLAALPVLASGTVLRILSITPAGDEVPPGRQLVLQYDRPVVPLGRMERDPSEVPVVVEPALDCQWRWISTSALSCRLGEAGAMRPSTRYVVTVRPGMKAQDLAVQVDGVQHVFVTQRAKVARSDFKTWHGPTHPEIAIWMNQAVELESLEQALVFVDPKGRQVAARLTKAKYGADGEVFHAEPLAELAADVPIDLEIAPGVRSLEGDLRSDAEGVVLRFYTFPQPAFLGVRCYANDGSELFFSPSPGYSREGSCNPMEPARLIFASPVRKARLEESLEVEPALAGEEGEFDPWDGVWDVAWRDRARHAGQRYEMILPGPYWTAREYHLAAGAEEIVDEFGRPLPADIELTFATDHRPPRGVLAHRVSVLEEQVGSHLPYVVTNLDELDVSLRALTPEGSSSRQRRELRLPEVEDAAYAHPLKVREWLGGSGVVFGAISPHPQPRGQSPDVFFSQVTPFAVHAKLGHFGTTVWVTDLASGQPVEGARVQIYVDSLHVLDHDPEVLSEAETDDRGLAELAGRETLDPHLSLATWLDLHDPDPVLMVRVDHGGSMALLPLTWEFRAREEGPYDRWISRWERPRHGHLKAWGTTAQGIYRVGSEIRYTILVRSQDQKRLVPAPSSGYRLRVVDPMDKEIHRREDVELDAFGTFHGEVEIPDQAAVGWYRFELEAEFASELLWEPLSVLVADFTPAPFRVTTEVEGELFEPGDEVRTQVRAALHAGGPYTGSASRVTATVVSTPLVTEPAASAFVFDTAQGSQRATVFQKEAEVDERGELRETFQLTDPAILHGRLEVEGAVQDDRGKRIAARATARFVGRDRFVGLLHDGWLFESGRPAVVQALVVDEQGEIVAGTPIDLKIEYERKVGARVKSAGNAYVTSYSSSWEEVAHCSLVSRDEPVACEVVPSEPGKYRAVAEISDTRGRPHGSRIWRWGLGSGWVLWETAPGHQLPVEPEKEGYEVGETARFLIRNPFPGATALFTIERYGVQESWTQVLEESTAVIEVEIEPDHLPGFYFSCVVGSPRAEATPVTFGEVDLGKPTFRMGYVRVPVSDPYKRIDVEIASDQEVYRPRDRARIELRARPRHPTAEAEPLQLAVTVLDEAVFDLVSGGSETWDPYAGFYDLEPLDLVNFDLLTRLVGLQKFEKKGANAGGGGGAGPDLRTLFEMVAYWNPALETDEEGRATIEVELPDNLTGWRVLAMAMTPTDRLGLGEGHFKVNRELEIRAELPNRVLEGDAFEARFTVMNRTESPREVAVEADAEGPVDSPGVRQRVRAEPWQRRTVDFPVTALADGKAVFTVTAVAGDASDALRVELPIERRIATLTAANWGTTTADTAEERIAFPEAIRADVGGIDVLASPSVVTGVDGAFEYMRDYPYFCWEQRLSKGVMASHFLHLRSYLASSTRWPGAAEVVERMLEDAASFQAPGGGMVYWVPEERYVSPYLSAYTALAFRWLAERGHEVPRPVEEKLQGYLRRLLREEAFPEFYSRGMASSVRAVALAALADAGAIELAELERYRRHVDRMDLFGKAHFLEAAVALDAPEDWRRELVASLLSHADESAGKLVFSERVDANLARILHSEPRANCSILSAMVRQQGGAPTDDHGVGDVPFRLVRSITQERLRRDRWENTQENVFCMNALIDFADAYEDVPPDLEVKVTFRRAGKRFRETLGKMRFRDLRDGTATVSRDLEKDDPGTNATLTLERSGEGRIYYATRLSYSPLEVAAESVDAGFEIRREFSVERQGAWLPLESPMEVRRGELVRVDLYLSLPAPRNFVVVDDPVPGGLEPVDRQLATASTVDAEKGEVPLHGSSFYWTRDDWLAYGWSRWSFYHRELRHDAARFFADYLPPGNYHLSYVAQAIATGEFQVLPLQADEMYDPDVFGRGRPATLLVRSDEP